MLRAADIMKPAGAFRAARVGFFGAAALDRQGIDRNGGFDMVFYFSGTGNSKYAARRARASAQNGAACTGCIGNTMFGLVDSLAFASALPARGASAKVNKLRHTVLWHTP